MSDMKKRDTSVELLRIIASMIVVGVHCSLDCYNADRIPDFSLTFIAAIFADGVGIFWMISGFFSFKNIDQEKNLIHTLKRIVLPVGIYILFVLFFQGALFNYETLGQSIKNGIYGLKDLLYNVALLNTGDIPYSGHLWFIMIYILIILILPLISGFSNLNKKNQMYFGIGMFLLFVLNDYMRGATLQFSHHAINALFPAIMIMLVGYKVYEMRDCILKKINKPNWLVMICCVLLFCLVNLIRACLVVKTNSSHFLYWYSCFGITSALCVFFFCSVIRFKEKKINNVIAYIGGRTFLIYVVHKLVIIFLNQYLHLSEILQKLFLTSNNPIRELIYTMVYMLIIWSVSLVLAAVLRFLKTRGDKWIKLQC